ncbi:MAG: aspartyl-tRNA(Asn)/glutamyl-tRNA (Gln) amidotransferase subunit C [Parcubacteria group bacterium LiPW_41]|nr:MAG: aspartyl-tRNA(Asn)/glutamyl-tRNA (Gln) amidotransferase subunit C [Parcubacteria group bacterium LiPW_41]
MTHISEKEIEHLADLSRIGLQKEEKEALVSDLEGILSYFDELKEVNTDAILPKTGGSLTVNELRDDRNGELRVEKDLVIQSFPDREGNLLKVPPVFEK